MLWILLLIGLIAVVECFIASPFFITAGQLVEIVQKSSKTLTSNKISDHWKEKVIPRYAGKLFFLTLLLFFWLCICFSPIVVVCVIANIMGINLYGYLMSSQGIVVATVIAIIYATARKKNKSDYSWASKALHHLSLGNTVIPEMVFDIEKSLYAKDAPDLKQGPHVFVSGLARAGTTILMRSLYETGNFFSLTYRDMPFVLAPNIWSGLNQIKQKQHHSVERAHSDGLLVGFDSPEALEEVFWRIQCGPQYIHDDKLINHRPDHEVVSEFQTYINLIGKKYQKQCYLSKNNNNILRIPAILQAFPQATIMVPFRDPLQHAHSLLSQHKHFSEVHSRDPFSRKYMDWLVHTEFGSGHKPFVFIQDTSNTPIVYSPQDTNQINYWLNQWINIYSALYDLYHQQPNILFVSYELLCNKTDEVWPHLLKKLRINSDFIPELSLSQAEISLSVDPVLEEKALSLYKSLNSLSEIQLSAR